MRRNSLDSFWGIGVIKRDDRILPITRLVSAIVVPFVAVAFVVLYLLPYPESLSNYFAWVIRPQMSAMLMGAGYMAGAYFFTRVTFANKWHHVALGFPGISAFAALAGLSTVLHWNNFLHGQVPFYIWVILYTTTPIIVPYLWIVNHRTDPKTFDERDTVVPVVVRGVGGVIGGVTLIVCAMFLLAPEIMIGIWPWQLSLATSRVGAAWFSLFAIVAMGLLFEGRWSALRITVQSLAVAQVLFLIAVVRAWNDFDQSNVVTWLFAGGTAGGLAVLALFYLLMERKCAR